MSIARATMQDVAQRAGVSPSTVSRVLNHHPRISQKTRQKVLRVVRELDFRPDPGAANLVAHRWRRSEHSGTLGVALVHRHGSEEANRDDPLFQSFATEQGFALDPISLASPHEFNALPRVVRARGLTGALVEFVIRENEVEPLQRLAAEIPCVISNHRQAYDVAPSVVRDAFHRVQDALRAVTDRGYRRIGLCLPGPSTDPSEMFDQMQAAFLLAQKKMGDAAALSIMVYQDRVLPELGNFVRSNCLEAVVGFEDIVHGRLIDQGWKVPEDVAYASMATKAPGHAGIADTREDVIRESIELLRMMIRAGQTGSRLATFRHEVRGKWVDGATLPVR